MLKAFKILSLLLIAMSFTSCIELVEEIKINTDLSGKYHLYLKHDGLEFVFKSITQNIDLTELNKRLQILEQQEGIQNLRTNINLKKGIFSIQFNFSDAKNLTRAFYASLGAKKRFYHKSFLKVNQSKIVRPNLRSYLIKYAHKKGLINKIPSERILEYVNYRFRVISPRPIKTAWLPNKPTQSNPLEYNQIYTMRALFHDDLNTKCVIRLSK